MKTFKEATRTMDEALAAWYDRAQAFRQKAMRIERDVAADRRNANGQAASFLHQLRKRRAKLEDVTTPRSGVKWPRRVQSAAKTYWPPEEGDLADIVDEVLARRVKRTQGRTLKGGK